ncbi:hypothetical protein ACFWNN_05715 [Lentzea sp. NPDC058450]
MSCVPVAPPALTGKTGSVACGTTLTSPASRPLGSGVVLGDRHPPV